MTEQFVVNAAETGGISDDDILFECEQCGKSIVIDRRGAGLPVRCPACDTEMQVPIPEDVDLAEIDQSISDNMASTEPDEFLSSDDLPPNLREQAQRLVTELQELRFRRGFLERMYARHRQGIQALRQQSSTLRATLDEIDAILRTMSDTEAADTQVIER